MLTGKCLCGDIEFACDIDTNPLKIYQCHCTLCKRQSGSSSNSATIIPTTDFKWIKNDTIKSWQKKTGFSSHFCANCGVPVPNLFTPSPNEQYYWIPVGLLDIDGHTDNVKVVANFCLNSKSSWHQIDSEAENFAELPEFKKLLELLS